MKKLATALTMLIATTTATLGQAQSGSGHQKRDLEATINRSLGMIDIAISEGEKERSDLELVESQIKQLDEVGKEYELMMEEMSQLSSRELSSEAVRAKYENQLLAIETRLDNNILLPHQLNALRGMVFERSVHVSSGDILKAIEQYYPDKIKLDDAQKTKLAAIGKRAKGKVAEAKKRFQAELLKIKKESEREARKLFTRRELHLLGEPVNK